MTDYISRADAIAAVCNAQCELDVPHYPQCDQIKYCDEIQALLVLPSADAVEVDRTSEWVAVRREEYEDLIADAEQVTGKLKKPCDSLLTDDSAECKEQKSKLDHDRDWIIGCIKHDGFIKTDRFDKANQIILDAIQADAVHGEWVKVEDYNGDVHYKCDQCGEEWTFPFGTPKENNANFCPCCGARMKGGDDE